MRNLVRFLDKVWEKAETITGDIISKKEPGKLLDTRGWRLTKTYANDTSNRACFYQKAYSGRK